jgi:hypothetical protein
MAVQQHDDVFWTKKEGKRTKTIFFVLRSCRPFSDGQAQRIRAPQHSRCRLLFPIRLNVIRPNCPVSSPFLDEIRIASAIFSPFLVRSFLPPVKNNMKHPVTRIFLYFK